MLIRSRPDPLAFAGAAALFHVRDRLWSTGQIGRAAVLVGAGFSRNAIPLTPNALPFPVWWELRDALARRLNMAPKAASDLSAMRLGSLVEASFGRAALDSVLQDTIPWQQYTPGSAHEKLLRLPWADVFTTNYDTLLEDARGQVVDRAYSLVLNAGDLPDRSQPRIVKLHGSFPSERPYLFTEEDFRAYPRSSAPFVNLVQGSMMENVMCMIGFSGEDPNFIAWSGWVRDNLGDHAPNIYLCGVLDVSDAQRRYLETRSVTPVDLGPLFPVVSWPDPTERHQAATEWLLDSLKAGELEDVSRWPLPTEQARTLSEDLRVPSVLPSPRLESGYPYTEGAVSARHLGWERAFRTYPGWELLGRAGRETLKQLIAFADDDIFLPEKALESPTDLLAASTVVRRAHLTALPISTLIAERLAKVVDAYHPFGLSEVQHGYSSDGPDLIVPADWSVTESAQPFNWADAGHRWMEMVLALTSYARVNGDEAEFVVWSERAHPYLGRQQQWLAQWHHEQVLFALGRHDLRTARRAIEAWPEATTVPFWETRRAALHAELGNTTEAWRIALRALDAIRKRLVASRNDPTLLSQEQWTVALLHRLAWVYIGQEDYGQKDSALRQRNLQDQRGFNDDELLDLSKTVQSFRLSTTQQAFEWGFDPEMLIRRSLVSQSWKWESEHEHNQVATALSLLDVLDRVACPPWLASKGVADGVRHAAYLVWPSAPARSISMLIRLRDQSTEHIKRLMTREAIVQLNETAVSLIFKIYITAFVEVQNSMSAPQTESQQIRGFSPLLRESAEVLSRLAFRLLPIQTEQLMGVATSCYTSLALRREQERGEITNLFRRLLEAMKPTERAAWLPYLITLPLIGEHGMELEHSGLPQYPEPIGYLMLPDAFDRSSLMTDPTVQRSIDRLIEKVEGSLELIRSGAAHRLHQLMRLALLTQDQLEAFWQALNTKRTADGLPADVYHAGVLMIHAPAAHGAGARLILQVALRRLVFGEGLSGQLFTDLGVSAGGEFVELGRVILLQLSQSESPEWSTEDTGRLSEIVKQRCLQYWETQAFLPVWPWDWNPALISIRVLGIVLLQQNASTLSASAAADVLTTAIQKAISLHVPIGSVVPILFRVGSWSQDQVLDWIKLSLGSNEPHRIMDVVHAIHEWATPAFATGIADSHPLIWTIRELCSRVRVRHPVALEGVLRALIDILSFGGILAASVNTDDLIEGLTYLMGETASGAEMRAGYDDRLVLRHRVSKLSAQLCKKFPDLHEISGSREIWQAVYSSDVLPEVREPWF